MVGYINTSQAATHKHSVALPLLRRYSPSFTAPRWPEPHCFSSWRSRARIPLCLLTSFCRQNLLAPLDFFFFFILSTGMCVCVCVFWDASLFCFNGERWHHSVQWPSLQAFPPEAALHWHLQVRLRLSSTLLMCPRSFGTFKRSHLNHLAKDTLKGENKWVMCVLMRSTAVEWNKVLNSVFCALIRRSFLFFF